MKRVFNLFILLTIIVILYSCEKKGVNSELEKYQETRGNVIDVKENIIDIKTPMIVGRPFLYIIDEYLIVCDMQNPERGIHLFNKNTFEYVTSTGQRGNGPNQIIRYARFGIDEKNKQFYVVDYGKMALFKFSLDSVLANPNYLPKKAFSLNKELFPETYDFINDSIIIGTGLDIIDHSSYNRTVVRCNIESGEIHKIGKGHPDIDPFKLGIYFALSKKERIYVEGYAEHDLLTISNLQGDRLKNIYGPQWDKEKSKNGYFYITKIIGDRIIASFNGSDNIIKDEHQRLKGVLPSIFILFSTNDGSYLKTLNTKSEIYNFCVDAKNNRIIAYFNDRKTPLGYIDLDDIN